MTPNDPAKQIELQLPKSKAAERRRSVRAPWWFAQMRQAVDRSFEWKPGEQGKPEENKP